MYFIGDEEIEALKKLFERKKLYRYQGSYQSECDLFEKEYADYAGSAHALLLSSGTNAISLALLSAGIQPGDEVLIPTYTFVATAAAVIHAGAIPVLVNIDKNLSLDLVEAEIKVTPKTKALILVHMDGLAANVAGAREFCAKKNLLFVEDACQAIGGRFEDKKLGASGDFGCFSLNENKNISCGEGGILITNNRKYYETAFCLHDGPAQFNPTKKDFFQEIKPFMGLSMRVSEISGAIMRVQLGRLDFILSELRMRKKIFTEALKGIAGVEYVAGYSDGECHSSVHLQFNDPEKGAYFGKKLREAGLLFAPVTTRPAHASWKWSHLLGEKSHLQSLTNPYLKSESTYNYAVMDYLQSVEILTKTLKMDVDINLSLGETETAVKKMREILTHE